MELANNKDRNSLVNLHPFKQTRYPFVTFTVEQCYNLLFLTARMQSFTPQHTMSESHCLHLERIYAEARINRGYFSGSTITVSKQEAVISLEADATFHHGMGAVHGSVFFKLLDDAAFFAAQTAVTDYFLVTTAFNIHFLRPATEGTIVAKGKLRFRSRNMLIADATLLNAMGKEIAFGTGHFAKSNHALYAPSDTLL